MIDYKLQELLTKAVINHTRIPNEIVEDRSLGIDIFRTFFDTLGTELGYRKHIFTNLLFDRFTTVGSSVKASYKLSKAISVNTFVDICNAVSDDINGNYELSDASVNTIIRRSAINVDCTFEYQTFTMQIQLALARSSVNPIIEAIVNITR